MIRTAGGAILEQFWDTFMAWIDIQEKKLFFLHFGSRFIEEQIYELWFPDELWDYLCSRHTKIFIHVGREKEGFGQQDVRDDI